MDKREAITIAQNYIDAVSSKYELTHAFIFGSYTKGNFHADSDIDIAVVLKNVSNLFDAQIDLLQIRKDKDLLIEPHPFRDADFNADNPLVHEILQAGLELQLSDAKVI